ncbi:hypothetical protein A2U01_0108459, partial [Trifolium medium]|nr:hypothetical protein [Trifolium medium]
LRRVHLPGRKRRLRTLRRSGHGNLRQSDAAETAHPGREDTEMEIQGDDVVHEMEEEEMVREGDE